MDIFEKMARKEYEDKEQAFNKIITLLEKHDISLDDLIDYYSKGG